MKSKSSLEVQSAAAAVKENDYDMLEYKKSSEQLVNVYDTLNPSSRLAENEYDTLKKEVLFHTLLLQIYNT